ncbi:hypothetical protein GPECTOR_79g106 [Gonium pectorale]|uniref:BTB domain-containing protein n=1 Tax=Gonium pectorale TaxID=33097 RepID=A0A150G1V0_GONPE|nr:hypothetical protein GPECTOR_79g106 [Gonium pectorale]|eukprot:KXZ43827.1 hypothetical protein GPECTOR_79g106 [Gonium pectorale]
MPVSEKIAAAAAEELRRLERPAATHGSLEAGRVTLAFGDGGESLSAQVFALQNASRVLLDTLSLPLPTSGVLVLDGDDDPRCWAVVVRMAEMSAYPPKLVTWDNVEGLLRLAEKYDMPVVRTACTDFLCRKAGADLSLSAPLTSQRNTLVAATLAERYCVASWLVATSHEATSHELVARGLEPDYEDEMSAFAYIVEEVLDSQLSTLKLRRQGQTTAPRAVASQLRPLVLNNDYATSISAAVQTKVIRALLDSF